MGKVLAVLFAVISIYAGSLNAAEKVRIGVPQQVIHWATFPLAQKKGFFKGEGLDAGLFVSWAPPAAPPWSAARSITTRPSPS